MEKGLLTVIPARGGSKGLPGKNIRNLMGKPLVAYSIDIARAFVEDEDICVSTDDAQIAQTVERYGLRVPFLRPSSLATDSASTSDVLLHALDFYHGLGRDYQRILLLQPTSPLRRVEEVREALSLFREDLDMVVSVTPSHSPAVLCNENGDGFVDLVFNRSAAGRQALPEYYEFNGAIYVISVPSLRQKGLSGFTRRKKYVMPRDSSVDIDDIYDFYLAEEILRHRK